MKRHLQIVGLGLLGLLGPLGPALTAQRTPDEALAALRDGNRRFAEERSTVPPLGEGLRRSLARSQSPFAIVVSCADSRVPPEHVFNVGLGDLFVVRVAGACLDPEALASVEYAAEHLGAQLCVVLTHESCGAIAASIAATRGQADQATSPALQSLLERLEPAVRKALARDLGGAELATAAEEEQAHLGATACLTRSPVLRHLASQGRFRAVAARYHLATGRVEWLPQRPQPAPADQAAHVPATDLPQGVPPHVALRLLQAGHRRFLSAAKPTADLGGRRRTDLTHGQRPLAIVVTCSDSRLSPEHLFDAGLGELFVVRVAGNVLNDDVLASVEYAALHTGASLCVVLGHSSCGAVTTAMEHFQLGAAGHLTDSMRHLMAALEPAVERARAAAAPGRNPIDLAIRANVQRFLGEARSRSAILRQLEQAGRFAMLPAVYDLASGDLEWLNDRAAGTAPAEPAHAAPAGETGQADRRGRQGGHDQAQTGNHGTAGDNGHAPSVTDPHGAPGHEPGAGSFDSEPEHAPHADPTAPAGGDGHRSHARASSGGKPGRGGWPVDPTMLLGGLGMLSLAATGWLLLRRSR